MATINIQRKKEYINGARSYNIYIDGQKAGTIANGETKEFITTAGKHTITAKIDWCSSPDIVINTDDNSIKTLTVGGFKNSNRMMLIASGIIALHFILKLVFNIDHTVYLLFPVFIFYVYILTIGRKKYVNLTEM